MTKTKQVLQSMLTENTGRSFLDSGGENGRHWQQNKGRDFDSDPTQAFYDTLSSITVNVYHWLLERVKFNAELTEALEAYGEEHEVSGLSLAEGFVEDVCPDATGLYGQDRPFTVNTYNHDCCLSQTLQYVFFELEGTAYVALQIHGGADVRGGYTEPQVFEVLSDGAEMFDFGRADWDCSECGAEFYTENAGYNWYSHGDSSNFQGSDVYVSEDGHGKCPVCQAKEKAS